MCNTHVNTHAHTASFNRSLGEQLCSHWVKDTKKNMLLKIKINNCCEVTQSHGKFPLERHWTAPGCCRGRSETHQSSAHQGRVDPKNISWGADLTNSSGHCLIPWLTREMEDAAPSSPTSSHLQHQQVCNKFPASLSAEGKWRGPKAAVTSHQEGESPLH